MTLSVTLISVVIFVLAFAVLRIVPVARGAIATATGAVQVMRNPTLDDDARERAVQKASISLFGAFASILLRFVATLVFAAMPIWVADVLGIVSAEAVIAYLSRIDVIVVLSVVMVAIWVLWAQLPR